MGKVAVMVVVAVRVVVLLVNFEVGRRRMKESVEVGSGGEGVGVLGGRVGSSKSGRGEVMEAILLFVLILVDLFVPVYVAEWMLV